MTASTRRGRVTLCDFVVTFFTPDSFVSRIILVLVMLFLTFVIKPIFEKIGSPPTKFVSSSTESNAAKCSASMCEDSSVSVISFYSTPW